MDSILEYHLKSAESMSNTILLCKRHGLALEEWSYYLSEMMRHSQAAIDCKLGRSRILKNVKEWT